ncbi:MAG TPA: apolipoprotein N-acyltransferase [Treponema sp.]|nr:apolipoprotein N-acyltransferase [Treponema sp.]
MSRTFWKSSCSSFLLLLAGAFLFAAAHPGYIWKDGVALLGFVALVPVFCAVRAAPRILVAPFGFLYGFLCYASYAWWLFPYNARAFFAAVGATAFMIALVFVLMRWLGGLFPLRGSYAMALVWCAYEYAKSLGFLGFSYGILGYTQWRSPLMLSAASLGGVWLPSAFCAFSAAAACSVLRSLPVRRSAIPAFVRAQLPPLCVLLAFFLLAGGFSIAERRLPQRPVKLVSVACIQHNPGSDRYSPESYRADVSALLSLTEQALAADPGTQIVVWPETAVVPPVVYHYERRIDFERYNIVVDMLSRLSRLDACFVIGNQHRVGLEDGTTADYNAALVFDRRERPLVPPAPDVYAKMHLVPFAEYIPFAGGGDGQLWSPGSSAVVFSARGVRFAAPVCFEDSFGSLCRRFVAAGAECFVNLTNDSWAQSGICQRQHLAMAVFRCAENRVPMVRATASGASCFIDSRGRVVREAAPFVACSLSGSMEIPVSPKETLYSLCGDWLALSELVLLLWLVVCGIIKMRRRGVEKLAENEVE